MLGIMPDAVYTTSELELHHGDCVLLYTDGISEAQNPRGDFLDLDRIKSWLASGDGHDARKFADEALSRLQQWRGGTAFDDDVTLVVARFSNGPEMERASYLAGTVANGGLSSLGDRP